MKWPATRLLTGLFLLLTLGVADSARAQEPPTPPREIEITPVTGNLYRVRDGDQHTVFLTTPAGIVVVDPLSRPAALSLSDQLAARFPGLEVRFVVLTHHHADRAEGASVFPSAEAVGHRNYNDALSLARSNAQRAYRFGRTVGTTFEGRGSVAIGDTTIELAHVDTSHARDMAVVYFPGERVLFASDPPPLTVTPFVFDGTTPGRVYSWIEAVRPLAPDTILFGNGTTMSGAAFTQLADYLLAVRTEVAAGYERGRTIGDLQGGALAAAHAAQPHYAARASHVEAVYGTLRLFRVDASGRATLSYAPPDEPAFCHSWTSCSSGGAIAGGTGALTVTLGTRLGVSVETTLGQQYWASRTTAARDEEVALRQSRSALLVRIGAARPGGLSLVPTAGIARTSGDVRGLSLTRGLLAPTGGFHPITQSTTKLGVTGGVDIAWTTPGGFGLVLPVRVTKIRGKRPEYWPAMVDVQAGIGVSVPIVRHVGAR
jgi:glyoxylase-like metal-dependent hydrolase (beta-lactamase superfamily II)